MTTNRLASFLNFDISSKLGWNGSTFLRYAMIISVNDTGDKIKYCRLPKTTEINWDKSLAFASSIGQKGFPD